MSRARLRGWAYTRIAAIDSAQLFWRALPRGGAHEVKQINSLRDGGKILVPYGGRRSCRRRAHALARSGPQATEVRLSLQPQPIGVKRGPEPFLLRRAIFPDAQGLIFEPEDADRSSAPL
jgi:hypothetical protein